MTDSREFEIELIQPISTERESLVEQERELKMKNLTKSVKNFLVSEDGPTAVEYAVMLALIVIVCLTAISAVGSNASARFNDIKDELS